MRASLSHSTHLAAALARTGIAYSEKQLSRICCGKCDYRYVLWRPPEQEWDVEQVSLEWFGEWTSQAPPPLEKYIEITQLNNYYGDEIICQ